MSASGANPASRGSVLARYGDVLAAAVPELAGHARAVAFDADTGRLDVVPDAPAYGTKLRWSAPKLIAAEPPLSAPTGPVKTRETASAGYQRALEAHWSAAPERHLDPAIAEAYERQTKALRERREHAVFGDQPHAGPPALADVRAQRPEAMRRPANRRAQAERAQPAPAGVTRRAS
ncbi:hypothetical protein GCM10010211_11820 [Streptomyces albospinus]|uniref:TraA n=1 Tax=Streptomyces albospinus TaxID=285515 RepID=A0ABQ2UQT5_9ACTN|nr:DUF721 domain-containing protein [Streptomyces albospinus]GGU49314.1 hypothetical protein GCM10010211_11820 [Streptomyces albospinus]